jgi:MFS transporter, ACS family, hexuronate transporter
MKPTRSSKPLKSGKPSRTQKPQKPIPTHPSSSFPRPSASQFRWFICGLLFLATTVNYIDRQVISILKQNVILTWDGWSELQYGRVVGYFQLAYAVMMIFAGALIDRIGIRKGFAIAIVWWSLAAMGHALSGSVIAFGMARVLLGLGEAANFPASIKAIAEWFPRRERALATGIFNSGTNIGAVLTPIAVAWILETLGSWRWVFILTGMLGFLWLILWLWYYRSPETHPRVSRAELALIQAEPEKSAEKMSIPEMFRSWAHLLKFRQTWAFAIGKGITDPVWWVWLFWVPGFLNQKFGVNIKDMWGPILVIYTMASVGSIGAGWLPAVMLKAGWSANAARKITMLICAVAVVPVIYAGITPNIWTAVLLIGLACGAHQGWSANIFTISSDLFPKRAIGSVVGIGGCVGGLGGYFISNIVGWVLNRNPDNYMPIFIIAGTIYLVALLVIHVLSPRLKPAVIKG